MKKNKYMILLLLTFFGISSLCSGNLDSKSFKLDVGEEHINMKLGETIEIFGEVIADKSKVKSYNWKIGYYSPSHYRVNYKDFIDANGIRATYINEEDGFFDFKATKLGRVYLKFEVTTLLGSVRHLRKVILVQSRDNTDDYGNTPQTAKNIELNSYTRGKLNTSTDLDYFAFRLDSEQVVYTPLSISCRKKPIDLIDSNNKVIPIEEGIPAGGQRFIRNKLSAGIYYLRIAGNDFCFAKDYGIRVQVEDVVTEDQYGDSIADATEVSLNSIFKGYLVASRTDKDFFKFTATENGTVRISKVGGLAGIPTFLFTADNPRINEFEGTRNYTVIAGVTYYFAMLPQFRAGIQDDYTIELTFTK